MRDWMELDFLGEVSAELHLSIIIIYTYSDLSYACLPSIRSQRQT
jgi:hypothetical protein